MSIATHSSSLSHALDQRSPSAVVVHELDAGVGPWPSMSYRAGVIARSLGLVVLTALFAVTGVNAALTALLVTIWAGAELTVLARRRAARQAKLLMWRPSGVRYSVPAASASSSW